MSACAGRSLPAPSGFDAMRQWFIAIIVFAGLASIFLSRGACADEPASYVGEQACSGCHAAQAESWKGSHHALAMQPAAPATVLGDFSGAQLEHFGVTTTFFRDGE